MKKTITTALLLLSFFAHGQSDDSTSIGTWPGISPSTKGALLFAYVGQQCGGYTLFNVYTDQSKIPVLYNATACGYPCGLFNQNCNVRAQ